ncbi:MAG: hypothetical protein COX81_03830 [Candidatus Magasanikbacteria bacterium CG_4_10_14_0_2_um_filter_37_12]|uniref:Cell division protein FtsX n=1 Tax=Candidatus Magasanikbacteria bacterium CG_4_10_14_0_2_um_filter_37_12 TaxID=1974637 RepID=A0A2M7V6P0_9BACT|nr:MAG: hypothetical protein COX81_03830 [Candidatus Magasanikbacteria bacterium CG_4_10_14_0_2_um_filter_37_12]
MFSFLRIIKFALQDIGRNFGLSLMTILILILMLLSVNTLFVIQILTNQATQSIKDQIDVSIYFNADSTDEEIKEVTEYINSFPEVVEVTFYSSEQVLDDFKKTHAGNEEILASLDELDENPLGPTTVIKTRVPSDYPNIIAALNIPEYENIIESKTFTDTEVAIRKIDNITTQVERFTIALSTFFGIIAFLIIFNTIRIAIYTQRIEISIKKLVGATNWFVRGPFLVESLIFSVVSTAVTFSLVLFIISFIDPYVGVIFNKTAFLTNYYLDNIILLVGVQFGVVLLLTLFSSILAIRRHLKV